MPIETICQKCARKLRVGDEFAGRKARCPHCKEVYTVPDSLHKTEAVPTERVSAGEQWRLRTEDGSVYGPVSKLELDSWLTEGRITAGCQLQRDEAAEWTSAATVYPALAKTATQTGHANPFADGARTSASPYVARTPVNPAIRARHHQPHRGGLILTLGILGVACCAVAGPVAWVMGQADLKQIREGQMDPTGRGLTQAGMVLGIIGTVILAFNVIFGAIGILAN